MTKMREGLTMESKKAALYMRLSKEDGTGESASISTQKKMLRSYAKENGFDVYREYVDDGYSGTNFERPAFKELLEDIERKLINLIITKDLSRLGRDYIMTGQYTEIYFPSKGVRYIAVNDGYDSESPWSDIAPFKNIVNEMYARDTSKKIRSAFRTKVREGDFIGNFAPYGYEKDPQDKNHLLIDLEASVVVKEIFEKAELGMGPSQIAGILNQKNVMTPALYRCSKRSYLNPDDYSKRKEWTASSVCKILNNPVYLGHIVQGKTEKVSFKSKVTLQKPRDEWTDVPNKHDPIISEEVFGRVRKRSISRKNTPDRDFVNHFSGLARCMDCGRNMSITGRRGKAGVKGETQKLVCGGYKLYGKKECTSHYLDYSLLCQILSAEIRTILSFTQEEEKEIIKSLKESCYEKKSDRIQSALHGLIKREGEIESIIRQLYEDFAGGKIEEDWFHKMLKPYEAERKKTAADRGRMQLASQEAETYQDDSLLMVSKLIEEIRGDNELPADLLHQLIDKIEVGQRVLKKEENGSHYYQTVRIYYRGKALEKFFQP